MEIHQIHTVVLQLKDKIPVQVNKDFFFLFVCFFKDFISLKRLEKNEHNIHKIMIQFRAQTPVFWVKGIWAPKVNCIAFSRICKEKTIFLLYTMQTHKINKLPSKSRDVII